MVPLELPVIDECRLDEPDLRAQIERWRRLGESIASVERSPGRLVVWFDPSVDAALMRETVAIECECCSSFRLRWDEHARRLEAGVEDSPRQDPALDALAGAMGAAASN